MPISVTITHKLSDRHFVAAGAYKSLSSALTGPASLLLEKTATGVKPVLDSSLHVSKIMDKEVISYIDVRETVAEVEIGKQIDLSGFLFKLK